MSNLPFTLDELQAAMRSSEHRGFWDITLELQALIVGEIRLFTGESRIDFESDSARNRETRVIMGALYTQALEVGYRLAGGDPTKPSG